MKRVIDTEVVYIPVGKLSVYWVQSQRPYNEAWAKQIADNLDPDMYDPIIVTKPNGEGVYHIIEGQHRRHALEMYAAKCNANGDGSNELAPCRIVTEADPARAAEIWLGVNRGRKAIRPIHAFKVEVVAKHEPYVTINDLVHRNGFRVEASKQKDCIAAVGGLKTVFDRHGKTTLNRVLATLRYMWEGDPQAVSSALLRGFGIFLHEFPQVDVRRLCNKVAERMSPYELTQAAEARKSNSLERLDEAISELLIREYNKGLANNKLKHKS